MFPIADVAPAVKLIYATIIFAALIVFAIYLKTRLDGRGVRVYAIVTNRLNPPGKAPSGLSGHNYMIFAKWTNPETQQTYFFAKESDHPLDYREGDIIPATINLEHPFFRHLDI